MSARSWALLLLLAGCDPISQEFMCTSSVQCRTGDVQGTCEPDGHCSLPDSTCPSMRRYVPHAGASSNLCVGTVTPPTEKIVPTTWYGMEQQHYHAPAAIQIALSAFNVTIPSQQTLASEIGEAALMQVTNGVNGVGTNPIGDALRKPGRSGENYQTIALDESPPTPAQQTTLRGHIVRDIDNGHPIVCTVESGFKPTGYPNINGLKHYVTAIGYRKGGDETLIADPGAEGSRNGFANVPRTYWITTANLGIWISGWGYSHPYP